MPFTNSSNSTSYILISDKNISDKKLVKQDKKPPIYRVYPGNLFV